MDGKPKQNLSILNYADFYLAIRECSQSERIGVHPYKFLLLFVTVNITKHSKEMYTWTKV